jgi:hypothetical protein
LYLLGSIKAAETFVIKKYHFGKEGWFLHPAGVSGPVKAKVAGKNVIIE